jgi:rRNA small subunit pseudouridine methyltransferase Nep1
MLNLLLADSELELVPREHWSHPCVVVNAKKRGKKPSQVLLDSTIHHPLFRDPFEKSRRGRPDIVHQFLLMGLDSLLNVEGGLRLWVHTRNNELIVVSPETRLPKNYARYQGLFEELLVSGAVPSRSKPLLELLPDHDMGKVLNRIGADRTILMHDQGEKLDLLEVFSGMVGEAALCVIGGFSVGDLMSKVPCDLRVSLHPDQLKVWTVEMEVLCSYRRAFRGSHASEGP